MVIIIASVVAPVFVSVTAVVMPVVMIPIVIGVADKVLAVAFAAEMVVHPLMIGVMEIGPGLVDDYLMAVIKIEPAIAGRYVIGEDPATSTLVNELVVGDVVIALNVGNVIVIDMIIAGGSPGWLYPDVDGNLDLCACGAGEGNAAKYGACQ